RYKWSDIIKSILAIYMCGGDCIEDLQTHFKDHFINNPFLNLPSPDTVLRRLSGLYQENQICRTKRGEVDHTFNTNQKLEKLIISLLKVSGAFDTEELTMDYDNTIIFNEKSDSKMTYKRNPGYQPGVCTINEQQVLYIENRNGNSDAKSFQSDTLSRVFKLLKDNNIKKIDHFRADAASYQYDVIDLLEKNVKNFYVGCRNDYIEKYFTLISNWVPFTSSGDGHMEVGEININPFQRQARNDKTKPKEYRLVVKRKLKEDKQLDLFTMDAFEYRAILTNNKVLRTEEVAEFYNHRGAMEKQFDILKNDFGWNNMPFSKLQQNTVFLYITAICRNLYHNIINYFSKIVKSLKPTFRIKKFLFRFIILPAEWIRKSRQNYLRIYGNINFST
ncbi:MAG: IS1380 family transposase, partial [Nitrosopumilales archaeon]